MVDPERPLPLATVIWFGSLEFMSLGHGYDMVLLPPRHSTDVDYELSQLGEPSASIVALVRHALPGNGEPGATTIITLQRVMVFSDPVPLSQTLTRISSLMICVG
jgi:hypothetical protein